MLNDAKYKSSVTLILETSKSYLSHSDRPVSILFNEHTQNLYRTKEEMNSNQLSKLNRTLIRSESQCETVSPNETIIPIKYLSHDENIDYNQHDSMVSSIQSSPKYCCTLEVKFVWYGSALVLFIYLFFCLCTKIS